MFDKEYTGFATPQEYLRKVLKVLDIVLHGLRVKYAVAPVLESPQYENVWGAISIGRKPRKLLCSLETEEATADTCFNVVLIDAHSPNNMSYETPITRVQLGNLYDLEPEDILEAAKDLADLAEGLL